MLLLIYHYLISYLFFFSLEIKTCLSKINLIPFAALNKLDQEKGVFMLSKSAASIIHSLFKPRLSLVRARTRRALDIEDFTHEQPLTSQKSLRQRFTVFSQKQTKKETDSNLQSRDLDLNKYYRHL